MNVPTRSRTIIDGDTGEVLDPRTLSQNALAIQDGGALSTIAAEINQQVATARKYPRRRDVELRNVMMDRATLDEDTASECMYSVPRGGKAVEGPSVRYAEIVQQAWGNNRVSGEVSHIDRENGRIFAEGIFLDLETNAATRIVITRRIASKDKQTGKDRLYSDDMIQQTGVTAVSIATRNAVLKGVPKAVWRAGYEAVRKVVMGDIKTLSQRRAAAVTEFQRFGITAAQLFAVLEVKDINDVTLDHLMTLRGTLSALKNGETTVEDVLSGTGAVAAAVPSAPTSSGGSGGGVTSHDNAAAGTVNNTADTPKGQGGGSSEKQPGQTDWTDSKCIDVTADFAKRLKAAATIDLVNQILENLSSLDGVPRGVVNDVAKIADDRKAAIVDTAQKVSEKALKAKADKEAKAAEKAASEAEAKEAQDKPADAAGSKSAVDAIGKGDAVYDRADPNKIEMVVGRIEDGFYTCEWKEDGKDVSAAFKLNELVKVERPKLQVIDGGRLPPRLSVADLSTEMRKFKSKKELNAYYDANVRPFVWDAEDTKELSFILERRLKLLVAE